MLICLIDDKVSGKRNAIRAIASVTADGSKTYSTVMSELYNKIDFSKVTTEELVNSIFEYYNPSNNVYSVYCPITASSSRLQYQTAYTDGSNGYIEFWNFLTYSYTIGIISNGGYNNINHSSSKPSNGIVLKIIV